MHNFSQYLNKSVNLFFTNKSVAITEFLSILSKLK